MSSHSRIVLPWAVRRTSLPLLVFPCVDCAGDRATTGDRRFRVNANGKLLDVWLLVNCVSCDRTSRLTVHHRVPVRSLRADLLAGYTANDAELFAATLMDPTLARRNRFALDWEGCWELHAPAVADAVWPLTVTVVFDQPVPVRPELLIAHGLGISRSEVLRRVKLDIPFKRRTTRDFSFVVMPDAP